MWTLAERLTRLAVDQDFTSSILVRVTNQIGAYGAEVTPVPFPNTEVKLCRDDDTWLATAWESNAVPVLMFLLSSVGRALGC